MESTTQMYNFGDHYTAWNF